MATRVLLEFKTLLQHSPSLLGSTHMLQIITINMFTIHNAHSRGDATHHKNHVLLHRFNTFSLFMFSIFTWVIDKYFFSCKMCLMYLIFPHAVLQLKYNIQMNCHARASHKSFVILIKRVLRKGCLKFLSFVFQLKTRRCGPFYRSRAPPWVWACLLCWCSAAPSC